MTSGTTFLMKRLGFPITSSAKAMFWYTFLLGSSRKSWNTQPILRRRCGTFQLVSRARSLPATWIRPSVGRSSLSTRRKKVDLPDPDGPTRKTNSPFSTSISTFSRAGRLWFGYALVTFSKWITGLSHALDEMRTACWDANRAPVWPGASLGGKLAWNVQHRRSDRVTAGPEGPR